MYCLAYSNPHFYTSLKIVFLTPAAQSGGAEAVLLDLIGVLKEARPEWSLHVVSGEDGPLLGKIKMVNATCEVLSFPRAVRAFGEDREKHVFGNFTPIWIDLFNRVTRQVRWVLVGANSFLYAWKLRRRLQALAPDVVHSNGMKMHLLGALAKPKRSMLIWHLHDYLGSRKAMKPLLRRLSSRCALVIANSRSVAADVQAVLPSEVPVETVHNTVDLAVFKPDGPSLDLDALAGLPPAAPGTVRIGLVATFALWKGHETFLRAAALTTGSKRFYVIGGPVYATTGSQHTPEELRSLAWEFGIEDRVGFTGFVDDMPAAIRALDIVVHASTEPEPFGLVIVQALGSARATIVSNAGGAAEIIRPGETALFHSPVNVSELASNMNELAADPKRRAQLGMAAREDMGRRFSRGRLSDGFVSLYEKIQANY